MAFHTLHKVGISWQAAQSSPASARGPKVLGPKKPGGPVSVVTSASLSTGQLNVARPRCQLADTHIKLGSVWIMLERCTLLRVGISWQAAWSKGVSPKCCLNEESQYFKTCFSGQQSFAGQSMQPFAGQSMQICCRVTYLLIFRPHDYFSIPGARVKKLEKKTALVLLLQVNRIQKKNFL